MKIVPLCLMYLTLAAAAAFAGNANFDSYTEGNIGVAFVHEGITFVALDGSIFTADAATATLEGPGFSPPNVLQSGGYNVGEGLTYLFQVRPFAMYTGEINRSASIDCFVGTLGVGETITLTAFMGDAVVATDVVTITEDTEFYENKVLRIEGMNFDGLEICSTGAYAAFDNFHIVPGIAGDVTGDGGVSVDDLVEVIINWGPCPRPPLGCGADLNDDGVVGVTDFIEVIVNWGTTSP